MVGIKDTALDNQMIPGEELLLESCRAATRDLGVEAIIPFILVDEDNFAHTFTALFEQFGNAKGTLVFHFSEWPDKAEIAEKLGYYCSGLNPKAYFPYSRALWIETFDDWGWYQSQQARPTSLTFPGK